MVLCRNGHGYIDDAGLWRHVKKEKKMKEMDHRELADFELEQKFEDHSLHASYFSHEAHLRLAYIHIAKYGASKAGQNMADQIKSYALAKGAKDKYNETVTIAAVKAMDHFMRKSSCDDFDGLIQEFPRLLTSFKEILGQHYGFDVFRSVEAKQRFLEPDLAPFT